MRCGNHINSNASLTNFIRTQSHIPLCVISGALPGGHLLQGRLAPPAAVLVSGRDHRVLAPHYCASSQGNWAFSAGSASRWGVEVCTTEVQFISSSLERQAHSLSQCPALPHCRAGRTRDSWALEQHSWIVSVCFSSVCIHTLPKASALPTVTPWAEGACAVNMTSCFHEKKKKHKNLELLLNFDSDPIGNKIWAGKKAQWVKGACC